MTVHEVSQRTGVSIRTLRYYDKIGLLHPIKHTEAGYRMYDESSLETLQQILLFRELEFSLKEIASILQCPHYDRKEILEQQINLLTLKRDHFDNLITFARGLLTLGGNTMDFSAFDEKKLNDYAAQAKQRWGQTDAYKAYAEKSKHRAAHTEQALAEGMMTIFADIGSHKNADPACEEVQTLIKRLQFYISEHYYPCTQEILKSLGAMYGAGGEFTDNIDKAGGDGTAKFTERAICIYCK